MDYFKRIDSIYNSLCELSGELVMRLVTQYHGLQLLDHGFYQYLIDEGIIEEEDDTDEL